MKQLFKKFIFWLFDIDTNLYTYIYQMGELAAISKIPLDYVLEVQSLKLENIFLRQELKKMKNTEKITDRRIRNIIQYIDNRNQIKN